MLFLTTVPVQGVKKGKTGNKVCRDIHQETTPRASGEGSHLLCLPEPGELAVPFCCVHKAHNPSSLKKPLQRTRRYVGQLAALATITKKWVSL